MSFMEGERLRQRHIRREVPLTGLSSSQAKRAFQLDLDALVQFSAFVDRGMIGRSARIPDFRALAPELKAQR
jgi:hypothetical protein